MSDTRERLARGLAQALIEAQRGADCDRSAWARSAAELGADAILAAIDERDALTRRVAALEAVIRRNAGTLGSVGDEEAEARVP